MTRSRRRIKQIKQEIENTDSDFDREKLQERLAKLSGGVAVVKVGAATETEMKEKKHRVEDALQATRAALEEGIVPGGGVALLNAADASSGSTTLEGDERTGASIILRALEEPLRQLAVQRGPRGLRRRQPGPLGQEGPGPERRHRRDRSTSSRPASSTRPWSPARRCRTPRRSRKNILTTEAIVAEAPEKPGPAAARPTWAAWAG